MIKKITVIGAGTMGHSIAHVYSRQGYKVRLYDSFPGALQKGLGAIREDLEFLKSEDYITQETMETAINNIEPFEGTLEDAVKGADYVIEAVPEDMDLKKSMFEELVRITPEECILATNTSSLQLSDILANVPEGQRKRCIICHWVNPAYLIPLVEISNFYGLEESRFEEIMELHRKCGKKPIRIKKEALGMISNRIQHALTREAFNIVEEGIGDLQDIDDAITYGQCFRFATTGLREIVDMGGTDIWYLSMSNTYPDLSKSDTVTHILKDMMDKGDLGVKSGKGFFDYSDGRAEEVKKEFYKRLLKQLKLSETFHK